MRLRLVRSVAGVVLCGALLFLAWPPTLGGATSYILVSGDSMEPTMHTGDLAVIRKQRTYRTGDIVAFRVPKGEVGAGNVVIHRIVGGDEHGYVMLGDNNDAPDRWTPTAADVVGERAVLVPRFGVVMRLLAQPITLGALAGLLAAIAVATQGVRNETAPEALSGHVDSSRPGRRPRRPRRAHARGSRSRWAQPNAGTRALHALGSA